MNKIISISLIIMSILGLLISGCSTAQPINNGIVDFETCAQAGNPVMESYPRQCSYNGITYTEELEAPVDPKPEEPMPTKPCTKEYMPVCGEKQVQCITAPCDPIKETYPNRCVAESMGATILYEGECKEDIPIDGIPASEMCKSNGGTWSEEYMECEGVSQEICENKIYGEFNECASACRNDPDATVCTLQCIQVCKIN